MVSVTCRVIFAIFTTERAILKILHDIFRFASVFTWAKVNI